MSSIDPAKFKLAVAAFGSVFQPRAVYRVAITGNEVGDVAVAGEPSLMWVQDASGIPVRVQRGTMNVNMPAGIPVWLGETVGYSSNLSQAQGVAFPQIDNYNGETFVAAWIGGNGAIAYSDSEGNIKGDETKLKFTEGSSRVYITGMNAAGMYIFNYGTDFPFINAFAAHGTEASPTQMLSGELLYNIGVLGYGATTFGSASIARLGFYATENYSDTAKGTRAVLESTPNGSTTRRQVFQAGQGGQSQALLGFAYSGVITPAAISTDENDYAPTGLATSARLRVSATTGGLKITGLSSVDIIDGQVVILENIDSPSITLTNNDSSSLSQNQFGFLKDVILDYQAQIEVTYEASNQKWRQVGVPATYSLIQTHNSQADTDYTAKITDTIIGYTSLSASRTVSLPPAANFPIGFTLTVKDESGSATTWNIVVEPDGAETIDGASNYTIATDYGAVTFYQSGGAWWITSVKV